MITKRRFATSLAFLVLSNLAFANFCQASPTGTTARDTTFASTSTPSSTAKNSVTTSSATVVATPDDVAVVNERIDNLIKERVQQLGIPGYCLSIVRDGKVMFQKGYGTTDLDNGAPVTSRTVFGLASLTKTFTALALLALVDQGKINLDDRLDKYLDGLSPNWQPITIRQLASMTGGILKQMPNETKWAEQFELVQEQPLVSTPGSSFLYSNFSYRALGSVMEKVTGKKYSEIVRDLITAPLGMNATGTQIGVPPDLLAWPYVQQGLETSSIHKLPPYRDPAIPYAAGMLFSNNDDLITYVNALIDGKILSPAGYQALWSQRPPLSTGQPNHWAFGWGVSNAPAFANRKLICMNGAVPGVASIILIFPEEKVAVVALSNLRKRPVGNIARQAAQIYLGIRPSPEPRTEEGPPESESVSVPQ